MEAAFYVQCELSKGNLSQVTFLPAEFAIPGKVLRLRDEDGWRVIRAGVKLPAAYVESHERDWRYQRQASDR